MKKITKTIVKKASVGVCLDFEDYHGTTFWFIKGIKHEYFKEASIIDETQLNKKNALKKIKQILEVDINKGDWQEIKHTIFLSNEIFNFNLDDFKTQNLTKINEFYFNTDFLRYIILYIKNNDYKNIKLYTSKKHHQLIIRAKNNGVDENVAVVMEYLL